MRKRYSAVIEAYYVFYKIWYLIMVPMAKIALNYVGCYIPNFGFRFTLKNMFILSKN